MRAITRINKPLPALLLSLFMTILSTAAFAEDTAQAPKNLKLSGLYLGFTPCDDCKGIKTTLALNANNSYVFITQYVGKSDREFVEKGKFEIGEENKLILTPKKGSTVTQQYMIDDDMLVKLDEDGNRITKDGADRYILHRKDVISSKEKHTGH